MMSPRVILFWFVMTASGGLPALQAQDIIRFIENKNQWPDEFDFVARVPGGRMALTSGGFRYYFLDYDKLERLHDRSHAPQPDGSGDPGDELVRGHAVHVAFDNANPDARVTGLRPSSEYYNYYLGNDPRRWAAGVGAYEGAYYSDLYPGVDLKVYATGGGIKYDFIVSPGGNPASIRMNYEGIDQIALHGEDLRTETPLAAIIEKRPVAWQVVNGKKLPVSCAFRLCENVVTFDFPDGYDSCEVLVIDPLLIFSTYSGSTADNWGSTATPGERGNLYSAGVTEEGGGGSFPATPGAFQTSSAGLYDIGILKYDSLGMQLLYATYLGGKASESPHSLVMNDDEELVLLGTTSSLDFPTTEKAYQKVFAGGTNTAHVVQYANGSDIVLARFSSDGRTLLASTYLGGPANDGLNPGNGALTRNYGDQLRGDVICDADGNVYVSSVTSSSGLLNGIAGASTTYAGGGTDALVFKMNRDLSAMEWGCYLGGSAYDAAHTIKLDATGSIYLAGGTSSADFPVTSGVYQSAYKGGVDGWIARLASDGLTLEQATYTGTAGYDQVYFLDINASGEVYVYGQTTGAFPVTPGVYHNPNSGQFLQKFSATLDLLIFSTVFGDGGGQPDISPTAFLVNDCNNIYMTGWGGVVNAANGFWPTGNGTHGMVTTADAFQSQTSGSDFYFIVLTEDAGELLYATFMGGTQSRTHVDGGTSRFDKGGIVYHSVCSGCAAFNNTSPPGPTSDFPTTAGAWSRINRSNNCNNAAFKFDLSSLKARIRTNSLQRDLPGLNTVCIPDPILFENKSTGGEVFEWDFGDGTVVSQPDTTHVVHAYAEPGVYRVWLKAFDPGTCRAVDSTSTEVTVKLAGSFVQDDADICAGSPYQLHAEGGASYLWTGTEPGFVSHDPRPVVNPSDTVAYYLLLLEPNGCVRRDTVQLNVVPKLTPAFEWRRIADCVSRPRLEVRNVSDSINASDVLFFDFGDGTTTDQDEYLHAYDRDGMYHVRIVGQREFCVYEQGVDIPIFELFVPNVITPGQPEYNDVFTVRFGSGPEHTPANYGLRVSLVIYNRWGDLIYATDDYQYDWMGEGLAAGIYYYEITVEGHTTCKSWLHLVK